MPLDIDDLVYRNTTGNYTGKGSPLTSTEGDENNFEIASAIVALQTAQDQVGAGIASITQTSPTTFIITLSDDTVQGPFTLPVAYWVDRGEWTPSASYAVNDLFFETSTMGFYYVKFAHTSETAFDPGANDGLGNDFYGLAMDFTSAASVLRQSTTKTEVATTHTISANDLGAFWMCTNAAGCAITIPPDSSYAAPVDTEISFRQGGAGALTFAATAPATLDVGDDNPATENLGAVVSLKKIAANSWIGWGRLVVPTA